MNLVQGISCINGQLVDLVHIRRILVVVVAIGPQPQLRIGVETVTKDWDRVESLEKSSNVPHFDLRHCLGTTVSLLALVMAYSCLSPVEVPVTIWVHALATHIELWSDLVFLHIRSCSQL